MKDLLSIVSWFGLIVLFYWGGDFSGWFDPSPGTLTLTEDECISALVRRRLGNLEPIEPYLQPDLC